MLNDKELFSIIESVAKEISIYVPLIWLNF